MKRLLALTEGPDFVCFRYRLDAFQIALAARGWRLEALSPSASLTGFARQLPQLAAADAVVLQRRLLSWAKRRMLRAAAKVLVYDFDDAMFLRDSNHRKAPHDPRRLHRFRQTVRMADVCFAGNDYLGRAAADCGISTPIHELPTCVDERRYPIAEHRQTDGDARLVWIGSRGTLESLIDARAGLVEAARRLPGLALKVICDAFPELGPVRVLPVAWSEHTEAVEIATSDVGIAWLPDHPWSLGKCGLKVLQYMAAGLPVVANPLGVHRHLVVDGETGFLAETPQQWGQAIETLARSPQLRRKMGSAARVRVVEHYSVRHWGPRFAAIIDASQRAVRRRRFEGAANL